MNIVNVGYASANYYVLGGPGSRLLVDVGWPGTLPRLLANLKRMDIPLAEIRYLLITHYHPDHAGLAQEVKAAGAGLIVVDGQQAALGALKTMMKPSDPYVEIVAQGNVLLPPAETRAFLGRMGIAGEIILTPGHSPDSISLVLDGGTAFTGDLPRSGLTSQNAAEEVTRSWQKLRELKVKTIYPGHGPALPLP
jgi:endoribonuclease LACTB2